MKYQVKRLKSIKDLSFFFECCFIKRDSKCQLYKLEMEVHMSNSLMQKDKDSTHIEFTLKRKQTHKTG